MQSFDRLPGILGRRAALFALALFLFVPALPGYSVLTHEAIVDSAWDAAIRPLLLSRFPQATPADLREAHGYAYAGCILQDLGYYPFGSRFFSDLAHYVRTGDFVLNLIRDSQTLDEYAFALGTLAHYAADTQGHSIATNRAVALQYPELRRKFGDKVTYGDKPSAHLKVEFGFDVLQVARGNYAPQAYHDFIGFQVARPVLERAFRDTYSLELKDVFNDLDLALSTYRHAVSSVIPTMTRVAWDIRKDDLLKSQPGLTRRQFIYNLSRSSYRKEWGKGYAQPGIGARILAFFLRILPKVGPLRVFAFKPPTAQTEVLFQSSFDRTLTDYRGLLSGQGLSQLTLPNRDLDTGIATRPAEYALADAAYAHLAVLLAAKDRASVSPQVRADVIAYFQDASLPFATKKSPHDWQATLDAVEKLKN